MRYTAAWCNQSCVYCESAGTTIKPGMCKAGLISPIIIRPRGLASVKTRYARLDGYSERSHSSSVSSCFQDGIVESGGCSATFSSALRFISRFARA